MCHPDEEYQSLGGRVVQLNYGRDGVRVKVPGEGGPLRANQTHVNEA